MSDTSDINSVIKTEVQQELYQLRARLISNILRSTEVRQTVSSIMGKDTDMVTRDDVLACILVSAIVPIDALGRICSSDNSLLPPAVTNIEYVKSLWDDYINKHAENKIRDLLKFLKDKKDTI